MILKLSPKDTTCKIELSDVSIFAQEGNTLTVVFMDGRIRNYPLEHIWYYESYLDGSPASKNS